MENTIIDFDNTTKTNKSKSYYECKRCFSKFNQKIDILRHLSKKKKCTRTLESFQYKDSEIETFSLQIMNKKEKKKYICCYCNKEYKNNSVLNTHMTISCKKKTINKIFENKQNDNNNETNIENKNIKHNIDINNKFINEHIN